MKFIKRYKTFKESIKFHNNYESDLIEDFKDILIDLEDRDFIIKYYTVLEYKWTNKIYINKIKVDKMGRRLRTLIKKEEVINYINQLINFLNSNDILDKKLYYIDLDSNEIELNLQKNISDQLPENLIQIIIKMNIYNDGTNVYNTHRLPKNKHIDQK